MTAGPVGFHHVQIAMPAGEEERAEAFYQGLLGLPLVQKPPELRGRGGCWFRGGVVELHLGVEERFAPAAKAHPALLVEGWDDLRARLREAGAAVVDDDLRIDGHRRFYAFDPFGNRLELIESESAPTPGR